MNFVRRRPWLSALALVAIVLALLVGSFGIYLGGTAGRLPWQEDPTRIAITPFADIPGFNSPASSLEEEGTPSPEADATPEDASSRRTDDMDVVLGGDEGRSTVSGVGWRR